MNKVAYEKGGRADKQGNRYEIRYIIFQILKLFEEKIDYVVIEPLGKDERGVDVLIGNKDGTREGHQCKGRNGDKEYWSFGDIKSKNILKNWKSQLETNNLDSVALVSPLAFTNLEDLVEKAQTNDGNDKNFLSQVYSASNNLKLFFNNFCRAMEIDTKVEEDSLKCISYLQRIHYHQYPDTFLKEIINNKITYLFVEREEFVYESLVSWIVEGSIWGKKISNSLLEEVLKKNGIRPKNLSFDNRIISRIKELNEQYNVGFQKINNELILREEFSKCRKIIDSEEHLVLSGKAGSGKSGCTIDIGNYCNENNIPYLAIKLDKYIPKGSAKSWGDELGLSSSIVHCVHSISKNEKAVIILDQLDALRWTQAHSRTALLVCKEIISQVQQINLERNHKISLVFVSRSYDLENDNEIRSLFIEGKNYENNISWNEIKVGDLKDNIVQEIVGETYRSLTTKVKQLLKIPSNLFIWKQINGNRITKFTEFSTTSNLVFKWWNQLIEEAHIHGLEERELNLTKDAIVDWMKKHGQLSMPLSIVASDYMCLKYLNSNNFIIGQEGRISFAHQSVLDCFLAQRMTNEYFEDRSMVQIIGNKKEQIPLRRYQVQIFLENLLQYDSKDFIDAGKEIFESSEIRYFMKFVFIEILSQIDKPDKNIQKFIMANYENKLYKDALINNVLVSNYQYIKLLRDNSILDKWFAEPKSKNIVFLLLRSICNQYTKQDIQFIKKYAFKTEKDDIEFLKCFTRNVNDDTTDLFRLRMEFYAKYPSEIASFEYLDLNEMFKSIKINTIYLLVFLLKQNVHKIDEYIFAYKEKYRYENSSLFLSDPTKVLDLLLPCVPLEKGESICYSNWSEKGWRSGKNLERICIDMIKKANISIISKAPELFWDYYEKYRGKGALLFNEIILEALCYLPSSYSDLVISYLLNDIDNNMFIKTCDVDNELNIAKRVLTKHAKTCSDSIFSRLETKIIHYFPPNAKEIVTERIKKNKNNQHYRIFESFWGDLQHELLNVLPKSRLNKESIQLIPVLKRKFDGRKSRFSSLNVKVGWVQSSISGKDLSDKNWLTIISNENVEGRLHLESFNGKLIENTIEQLSNSFRIATTKEPVRMLKLVVANYEKVLSEYIDSLLIGVAESRKINEIPFDLLEDLIMMISYDCVSNRAYYVCLVIKKAERIGWPDSILDIVSDIALYHKDSGISDNIVDQNTEMYSSLENNALNCVRGSAAETIGKLIQLDNNLLEKFRTIIESLVYDKNPAVNLASLVALVSSFNIDKKWAARLIINLFKQDIRLVGFPNSREVLFRIYPMYKDQVISIIYSCYYSKDSSLINVGGHCVYEMFIQYGEFKEIFDYPALMSTSQAKAIMEIAVAFFDIKEYNLISKEIIYKLKERKDEGLSISHLFYNKVIDLVRDKTFLVDIMSSYLGQKSLDNFITYLEEESKSLIEYSDIILSMSTFAIQSIENKQNSWIVATEIPKLIIGLYDEAVEDQPDIAESCLDLWDLMFEKQISPNIRKLSLEIMNR